MANPEHLAKLKEGVEAWNCWIEDFQSHDEEIARPDLTGADLRDHKLRRADLRCVDLDRANLSGADLSRATLRGASLRAADLERARLFGADLTHASLDHANLRESELMRADLSGAVCTSAKLWYADLTNAQLVNTRFTRADLRETLLISAHLFNSRLDAADLRQAYVGWTVFANIDLRAARGIELVQHRAPSTIGTDTIVRSGGNIPEAFLHGCGVPEAMIAFARSLTANPTDFYSCFISYSSKDQKFAERLHADLRGKSLRVWFAPEDLKTGDRFQERIEHSIRLYDKIMILLSENSVASPWVESEVEAARERERREKRLVLFPIRIDDAVMDTTAPWAADLRRQRHIGDFRQWKDHDAYHKAFARLLRDLQAKDAATA